MLKPPVVLTWDWEHFGDAGKLRSEAIGASVAVHFGFGVAKSHKLVWFDWWVGFPFFVLVEAVLAEFLVIGMVF